MSTDAIRWAGSHRRPTMSRRVFLAHFFILFLGFVTVSAQEFIEDVEVFNLFNETTSDIDYLYESRLASESAPVEGIRLRLAYAF